MRNKLLTIIVPIADYLARRGVYPDGDALLTALIKTQSGYRNAMRRAVYSFYNHKIGEFDFVGIMIDLIEDQMRRAYNEGLRAAGFKVADMTAAMLAELVDIIDNELGFVLGFASDILANRDKYPRPPSTIFNPRIDVWANRYSDVVNRATLAAGKERGILLEWKLGVAEHCSTCLSLDGTVATAEQWIESGYQPQNPPNEMLECGGWNCQCALSVTDKDETVKPDGVISV